MFGYDDLRKVSNSMNEHNDCSVVAVAAFLKKPYEEVHAMFEKHGRKKGQGVFNYTIYEVLKAFGCLPVTDHFWEGSKMMNRIKARYPKAAQKCKNITTKHFSFFPEAFKEEGPMLVFVRGHVACFDGETLQDWSIKKPRRVLMVVKAGE